MSNIKQPSKIPGGIRVSQLPSSRLKKQKQNKTKKQKQKKKPRGKQVHQMTTYHILTMNKTVGQLFSSLIRVKIIIA